MACILPVGPHLAPNKVAGLRLCQCAIAAGTSIADTAGCMPRERDECYAPNCERAAIGRLRGVPLCLLHVAHVKALLARRRLALRRSETVDIKALFEECEQAA